VGHRRSISRAAHPTPHGYLHAARSGDSLFTWNVYVNSSRKPWVAELVTPYLVLFSIAAVVSLATLIKKGMLLVQKFRSRRHSAEADGLDVDDDRKWREEWIGAMESQQQSYNQVEQLAIATSLQLLGTFAVGLGLSSTKLDPQSNRLVGATTCTVLGAKPDQVAAYIMHADSHAILSGVDPNVNVRYEVLERPSTHAVVVYTEMKTAPFQNRTFLNLIVCQKRSNDVWICAAVPQNSHARIGPHDEQHTLRAEATRCFRLTAISQGETLVEYCCWLDLKGSFPVSLLCLFIRFSSKHLCAQPCNVSCVGQTWFTNRVAVPALQTFPFSIQNYFSRILDVERYKRLEDNRLELRKLYCLIALGLAEDVPMSGLSIYYLVRSLDGPPLPSRTPLHPILAVAAPCACAECIDSAIKHRIPSTDLVVCDLSAGNPNLLNVVSVITSVAMLMYKVCAF
jgi:hypothetical protein